MLLKHTNEELRQWQSLPLDIKLMMTQDRIRDWINEYGTDGVYVSYSGGKDSSVLLDIVRKMYGDSIQAVFVNTGLEYPEVREQVKWANEHYGNIVTLVPKLTFKQVIEKYGYPVGSKEVARKIEYYRKGSAWAKKYVEGYAIDPDGNKSRFAISDKLLKLVDAPFKISASCCAVMKKDCIKKYERKTKRHPILGTMADESRLREQAWKKNGCNAFDAKHPLSQPMAFWKKQDVLQYIYENNVRIASVYGDVQRDLIGNFNLSGIDRTGCMFCMFGVHLEKSPNRFERMKITHPKQYDYCINKLNLKEVLDYMNVKY